MKRRSLLQFGLGAAVLVGVVGGGLVLMRPGWVDGRLAPEARELMRVVALSVMDGLWPAPGAAREAALQAHLERLDTQIAGYPAAVRAELSQVLALLTRSGGRLALVGLTPDWSKATVAEVQEALNDMRVSRLAVRQQIYRALRELNCIAFFTAPEHWALTGYPGPREIP